MSERYLIRRLRQGDTEALREIYLTHKDGLLTLAYSLVHDMSTAEDILHDVFVSFAAAAEELKLRTSLHRYLSTSVLNRARDHFRRKKIRAAGTEADDRAEPATNAPEEAVVLAEQTQQLTAALAELPVEQREAVTLRLNAGLRFKEIARMQETSVPTVQARYRYGIEKLRALLRGGAWE
ncbi:MAG: sigma-70 family RNA polymerase sigma factor [Phycisphaerales bacterium]|nr:MAG: sigma-70 family RNA polymerase sigma factor [Phycisphaerales bacterium]